MASKVIVKKQKASDLLGHLAIRHMHFNRKKTVSLGIKISEQHYDDHFNQTHQRFDKTTVLDYITINNVIKSKIDDLSCFGLVDEVKENVEEGKHASFIEYFKKNTRIKTNPSTVNVRNSVFNKIEGFREMKGLKDISFNIIDYYLITELKNFIRITSAGSTTKAYMDVIKSVLNRAKRDMLYSEKYNYFEDLDYNIHDEDNSALTKDEVQRLIAFQSEINSYELNMFLIAIFLHGIRASDLFFLRHKDFGKEAIVYKTKKTGKKMSVRYDEKLVTLLCKVKNIKNANETNLFDVTLDNLISEQPNKNEHNKKYGITSKLVEHINSLPKKDFLFKTLMDKEPILMDYDKNFEMTKAQHEAYIRLLVYYNSKLKKVAKSYEVVSQYNIAKITSHTSRYTFANLCLDVKNPDINAISRALGHSSLKTTMDYFNKNFGENRVEKLAKQFNSEFEL